MALLLCAGLALIFVTPTNVSAAKVQENDVIDFEFNEDLSRISSSEFWPVELDKSISAFGGTSLKVTPHQSQGTWPRMDLSPLSGSTWDLSNATKLSVWVRNNGTETIDKFAIMISSQSTINNSTNGVTSYMGTVLNLPAGEWVRLELDVTKAKNAGTNINFSAVPYVAIGNVSATYENRSAFHVDNFRITREGDLADDVVVEKAIAKSADLTMMKGASIFSQFELGASGETAKNRGIRFGMTMPKTRYDELKAFADENDATLNFGMFVKPVASGYSYELSEANLFESGALYYWDDNDLSTRNGFPTTNPKTGNVLYSGWSAEIYDIYNLLPRIDGDTVYLFGFLVGFDNADSIVRDYIARGYLTVTKGESVGNQLANYVDENGASIGRAPATTVEERTIKEENVKRSMGYVAQVVIENNSGNADYVSKLESRYFTAEVKAKETTYSANVYLDGVQIATKTFTGNVYTPISLDNLKLNFSELLSDSYTCSKHKLDVTNSATLTTIKPYAGGRSVIGDIQFTTNHDFPNCSYESDGAEHWKQCTCGAQDTKIAHDAAVATCITDGVCTTCNNHYIAKLGHSFSNEWTANGTQHWHACTRMHNGNICEETGYQGDLGSCSGGSASYWAKAICTSCSNEHGEVVGAEEYNVIPFNSEEQVTCATGWYAEGWTWVRGYNKNDQNSGVGAGLAWKRNNEANYANMHFQRNGSFVWNLKQAKAISIDIRFVTDPSTQWLAWGIWNTSDDKYITSVSVPITNYSQWRTVTLDLRAFQSGERDDGTTYDLSKVFVNLYTNNGTNFLANGDIEFRFRNLTVHEATATGDNKWTENWYPYGTLDMQDGLSSYTNSSKNKYLGLVETNDAGWTFATGTWRTAPEDYLYYGTSTGKIMPHTSYGT